jgi:hypothetical protein
MVSPLHAITDVIACRSPKHQGFRWCPPFWSATLPSARVAGRGLPPNGRTGGTPVRIGDPWANYSRRRRAVQGSGLMAAPTLPVSIRERGDGSSRGGYSRVRPEPSFLDHHAVLQSGLTFVGSRRHVAAQRSGYERGMLRPPLMGPTCRGRMLVLVGWQHGHATAAARLALPNGSEKTPALSSVSKLRTKADLRLKERPRTKLARVGGTLRHRCVQVA